MSSYVLVPGAWLGGWAWDKVAEALRADGHDVTALTLTGLAERSDAVRAGRDEITLDTHVADIIDAVRGGDLHDVILVGHSYGGQPVSVAAGRLGGRLKAVVYVDSGELPEGTSQFDANDPEMKPEILAQVGDSGLCPPMPFDPARTPDILAGLDDEALRLMRAKATPHPFASMTQPVRYDGPTPAPVTLVSCIMPAEVARQLMAAGHPFFARIAGAEIVELPTGHWPMFSEPKALAEILSRLG
jgi:pimeloyl-ACP methyl ester carboxylesterase